MALRISEKRATGKGSRKCSGVAAGVCWRVGETRVSDGAEVKLGGWDDGRKLIVSFEFHVGNK